MATPVDLLEHDIVTVGFPLENPNKWIKSFKSIRIIKSIKSIRSIRSIRSIKSILITEIFLEFVPCSGFLICVNILKLEKLENIKIICRLVRIFADHQTKHLAGKQTLTK